MSKPRELSRQSAGCSDMDIAIEGFDTVAYFTEGKARPGSADFSHEWRGQVWQFASAEHRDKFAADPTSYAPQLNAQCAMSCAMGRPHPGNPRVWKIVDGKLYFNNNPVAGWLWKSIPGMVARSQQS